MGNRIKALSQLRQNLLRSTAARCAMTGTLAAVAVISLAPNARALNLYSGTNYGNNLEINLSTTVEYSNFYRVNDPSAVLTNNINGDEGDRDFRHGFVSNQFEVTPVLDFRDGNYGAHFSGDAYLNTSYLDKNQNNSPGTFNPISTFSNRDFTSATRNVNGENAEVLDAFVYGSQSFGAGDNQQVALKVGRQTLLWGQSLFFSQNGIAAGQAPIDVITAQSLPNAQTQQIVRPIGQAVFTYQPNQILTFQGYYQFEYEHDKFQGVGAYFSSTDILDKGGQSILVGPASDPGVARLYREKDFGPGHNGQFGLSMQAQLGGYDLGFYGLRYDAKAPEVYAGAPGSGQPANSVGSYWLVYPRDIQVYGASVSTDIGSWSVGGELSGRRNMPLDAGGFGTPTSYPGSANAGAQYPVGSTMAAQVSELYVSPPLPFFPGGLGVDGEFAMNHVISIDKNKAALAPGRNATAGQFEVVLTPSYYNWIRNTVITFPVGITYNLFGRSEIDSTENHGTGTLDIGVTAVYNTVWTAGLTYQDYLGAPNIALNPDADRGYLSFNIERTF
jgi:hypothetical protein